MKHLTIIFFIFFFLAWLDPYKDAMNRGNGLYGDGKYPDADQAYMNAYDYLPSEKERPFVAFNRGDALFKAGDYDGAIDRFSEALDTDDPDLQKKSFFNMGNAYYQKGDKEKALESWMNALKIDPEYTKAQMNIEKLFQEEDEQEQQQKNNQDQKGEENPGKDKKDSDQNKQNEQNSQNQTQSNPSSHKKGDKIEQELSDEQIDNLLQQFKKRPLQRKEGDSDQGGRGLEQDW